MLVLFRSGGHPKRGKVKSIKLKIGLLWHSVKSGNLGVGALTMANMAIARKIAEELGFEPAFTIIGVADKGGAYVQPEEAKLYEVNRRRLLARRQAMTVIGRQDCVLAIRDGDSFEDIHGLKQFLFMCGRK